MTLIQSKRLSCLSLFFSCSIQDEVVNNFRMLDLSLQFLANYEEHRLSLIGMQKDYHTGVQALNKDLLDYLSHFFLHFHF